MYVGYWFYVLFVIWDLFECIFIYLFFVREWVLETLLKVLYSFVIPGLQVETKG
jgi:hypothetical protein